MAIKRKSGTVAKLETLAKQIHFYRDRYRVYLKMAETPHRYLHVIGKIMVPGKSESVILNFGLPRVCESFLMALKDSADAYGDLEKKSVDEFLHIVRMHFPDKIAQDKIYERFLPTKIEKHATAPKQGGGA